MTILGKIVVAALLTIVVIAVHEALHAIPKLWRLLSNRRKP